MSARRHDEWAHRAVPTRVSTLGVWLALALGASGCGLFGPSDPQGNPAKAGAGNGAGSGSGEDRPTVLAPNAGPPAVFTDGVSRTPPARYAAHKPFAALLDRMDAARAHAREKLASRLGIVADDASGRTRVYFRWATSEHSDLALAAPEVPFARLDQLVLDGDPRPVVDLHPEPILAGVVTLDEAVAVGLARAAVLARQKTRAAELPAWFTHGAAYHAAERTDTLVDRTLAFEATGTRDPRELVRSPLATPTPSIAAQALYGALAFAWVEQNRGPGKLKAWVELVTRADAPVSLEEASRAELDRSTTELEADVLVFGRELLAERASRQTAELRAAIDLAFVEAKDYPRTIRELSKVRDASPHGYAAGIALYYIGQSHLKLERPDLAFEAFDAVVANHARTAPDLDRALYWAARCRLLQRRGLDAIALLERLTREFPGSAERADGLLLLGRTLAEVDEGARAEAALVERLSLVPDDFSAPGVEARLVLAQVAHRRFALAKAREWLAPLASREGLSPEAAAAVAAQTAALAAAERAELPPARAKEVTELARSLAMSSRAESSRAALYEIGPVAAATVGRQLKGAVDPAYRAALIEVLAVLADARGGTFLVAELATAGPEERGALLRALLRLGTSPELLAGQLDAAPIDKAKRALIAKELDALALGTTADLRGKLPELLAQLSHPDPQARLDGGQSLNRLQDPDGVVVLARVLGRDPDARVRTAAIDGLAVWGDARAVEAFLAATGDSEAYVRGVALQQLVRHGHKPGAAAALQRLADPDPAVRAAAYRAVALLGGVERLDLLLAGTADADDAVHRAATDGLLSLAAVGPRERRQLVRDLIPRIERTKDRPSQLRWLYLLGQLTGLELRAFPGIDEGELVRQLDRARLWLGRG